MTERITGMVAEILNLRELVINKGERDGVRVGMRFAVLNRKGADITDPETGEPLGSVEVEKTVVKVVRTTERVSVARTFRTFSEGFRFPVPFERREFEETLRTDEKTHQEELDEEESYVKRGDPVVQVLKNEFD